jgi:hypothetical protein
LQQTPVFLHVSKAICSHTRVSSKISHVYWFSAQFQKIKLLFESLKHEHLHLEKLLTK